MLSVTIIFTFLIIIIIIKADKGETSTVGGETSSEWAKRPGGETSSEGAKRPGAKHQRGETSRYRVHSIVLFLYARCYFL